MSNVPVLVPEGKDFTDLTVGELDKVSRELKADVLAACANREGAGYLRWGAMARVAWLWARRTDPQAKLATFLDYEPDDLLHALRMDEVPEPPDPTNSDAEQSA